MGRRNIINKFQVMDAEDSTSDPVSTSTDVSGVDFITYQIEIDALVDATLEVYFCNDDSYSQANATQLDFGQPLTLDGATETNYTVQIRNMGFKNLAIKIVDVSGSGDVSAWITGTGVGA
jgi:hypothetical protein